MPYTQYDIYLWFANDYSSFYIHPVSLSMGFSFFDESIVDIKTAIPNDNQNEVICDYHVSRKPINESIYFHLIGMKLGYFLKLNFAEKPIRMADLYEFDFLLDSGKRVSNIGAGLHVSKVTFTELQECVNLLNGHEYNSTQLLNIESWETERFYVIRDGKISTTEHRTKDLIDYVCGLFIPEIFGL